MDTVLVPLRSAMWGNPRIQSKRWPRWHLMIVLHMECNLEGNGNEVKWNINLTAVNQFCVQSRTHPMSVLLVCHQWLVISSVFLQICLPYIIAENCNDLIPFKFELPSVHVPSPVPVQMLTSAPVPMPVPVQMENNSAVPRVFNNCQVTINHYAGMAPPPKNSSGRFAQWVSGICDCPMYLSECNSCLSINSLLIS